LPRQRPRRNLRRGRSGQPGKNCQLKQEEEQPDMPVSYG
jgi:hypothetical protein